MLRGVLFDLDDTLVDTAGVDERVWPDVVELIAAKLPGTDGEQLHAAPGFGAVVWLNPDGEPPKGVTAVYSLAEVPQVLGLA